MTLDERAESVHQFATNRRVMVMLMSTKAGACQLAVSANALDRFPQAVLA